jgi:diguanylate cyclase (GGDEF)-like protein
MRRRLTTWLVPHFADVPESERNVQSRAMVVAWIGSVGLALLMTFVEMALEWATPVESRALVRPFVFMLVVLVSTAMVMRASYRQSAKFYIQQSELNQAFEHQARFDSLTDLPNRRQFHDHLERSLAGTHGQGAGFALLMIDLDGFKDINDTFGHAMGDLLLQGIATRLHVALRPTDLVARLGGDEFAVVLAQQPRESVVQVADRLVELLGRPLSLDSRQVQVSASIGIALCPEDGANGDLLLRHADLAMYAAKRNGGSYAFYTHALEPADRLAAAA